MSIEEQNKMLKERLMTVEHEKFKLAQQVAKLTAEMSKYRSGSLAPPSAATSCAPSPSLQPELFSQTNIKQEFDDFTLSLPTPQSSAIAGSSSLTPPSTSLASSRSTSPAHSSFGVMTSSPDMTQHPAEMLCGLQCQSGAATAASTAVTSRDEAQRQRQRRILFALCTQVSWMTLISAVYSHLLHPLRLIFISLRTGSPLPISTTTAIPPMISLLIRWLISTPANLTTTAPAATKAASSTTRSHPPPPPPPPPTFRIRLLRRLLLCSPALARPLKDAAGGASRLRTRYALNRMSEEEKKEKERMGKSVSAVSSGGEVGPHNRD